LEYALWCVGIFVGDSTAYRRRMHADFFGHLLDHHGFQEIDSSFQKFLLAGNNGVANFRDGLLTLLDVLDQLNGALVALFHVVARVLVVVSVTRDELLVGRIEAQLGQVFVVHDDQPLISVLHKSDIRLNQASLDFVVSKPGTRIEGSNVIEGTLDRFDRASDGFGNFLVLFVLHATQVLIDDRHGVLQYLHRTITVFVLCKLSLMKSQLVQQALPKITASHSRRIQLLNDLEGFLQLGGAEVRLKRWNRGEN